MKKIITNTEHKINPWEQIPLEDYESHMSHTSVGQLQLLTFLAQKYISNIKPESCIFLGITGGNGLEHIDNNITKNVIGIDINQDYLDETKRKYGNKIKSLQLINCDITKYEKIICKADFIWAALIMEYTGIEKCLTFSEQNLLQGGHLILTIQINNKVADVSPTGIESIQKAGEVFTPVNPEYLQPKATEAGFSLLYQEENKLPNGKSFKTFHFIKNH